MVGCRKGRTDHGVALALHYLAWRLIDCSFPNPPYPFFHHLPGWNSSCCRRRRTKGWRNRCSKGRSCCRSSWRGCQDCECFDFYISSLISFGSVQKGRIHSSFRHHTDTSSPYLFSRFLGRNSSRRCHWRNSSCYWSRQDRRSRQARRWNHCRFWSSKGKARSSSIWKVQRSLQQEEGWVQQSWSLSYYERSTDFVSTTLSFPFLRCYQGWRKGRRTIQGRSQGRRNSSRCRWRSQGRRSRCSKGWRCCRSSHHWIWKGCRRSPKGSRVNIVVVVSARWFLETVDLLHPLLSSLLHRQQSCSSYHRFCLIHVNDFLMTSRSWFSLFNTLILFSLKSLAINFQKFYFKKSSLSISSFNIDSSFSQTLVSSIYFINYYTCHCHS